MREKKKKKEKTQKLKRNAANANPNTHFVSHNCVVIAHLHLLQNRLRPKKRFMRKHLEARCWLDYMLNQDYSDRKTVLQDYVVWTLTSRATLVSQALRFHMSAAFDSSPSLLGHFSLSSTVENQKSRVVASLFCFLCLLGIIYS